MTYTRLPPLIEEGGMVDCDSVARRQAAFNDLARDERFCDHCSKRYTMSYDQFQRRAVARERGETFVGYCSRECFINATKRADATCACCGKAFHPNGLQGMALRRNPNARVFCSRECFLATVRKVPA